MEKKEIKQLVRRALGREVFEKKDELVYFCPKHDHHKPKLSINILKEIFHCWFCGWGSDKKSLIDIIKFGGNKNDIDIYRKHIKEKIEVDSKHSLIEKKIYTTPILPDEYRPLSDVFRGPYYGSVMEYLRTRGVTSEGIRRYKLGYCETGEYRNRIIFPSFDDKGELNFFIGRAIYDNMLKYKHGEFDKDIIWNEYSIDWSSPIKIVEGQFDALKAGFNAIPLLGSDLNIKSKLFKKIVESSIHVFVALDRDAYNKQLSLLEKFVEYGVESFSVNIGDYNDVGEMVEGEFDNLIRTPDKIVHITKPFDIAKLRLSRCA